jgi:hypothetical protein
MRRTATAVLVVAAVACGERVTSPTEPARSLAIINDATAARSRAARDVRAVQPACPEPAKLLLAGCPGPGYIVLLKPGNDATNVALTLGIRYGFTARSIWQQTLGTPAFYAIMSVQTAAALQCEPVVQEIEENSIASFPETPVCQ